MEETHRERCGEGVGGIHAPSRPPPSQHLQMLTNLEGLWTQSCWVSMEA